MTERDYEKWLADIKAKGIPDPPVIFAGNWARKAIRDLEAERDSLRQQLEEAVERIAELEAEVARMRSRGGDIDAMAPWEDHREAKRRRGR